MFECKQGREHGVPRFPILLLSIRRSQREFFVKADGPA